MLCTVAFRGQPRTKRHTTTEPPAKPPIGTFLPSLLCLMSAFGTESAKLMKKNGRTPVRPDPLSTQMRTIPDHSTVDQELPSVQRNRPTSRCWLPPSGAKGKSLIPTKAPRPPSPPSLCWPQVSFRHHKARVRAVGRFSIHGTRKCRRWPQCHRPLPAHKVVGVKARPPPTPHTPSAVVLHHRYKKPPRRGKERRVGPPAGVPRGTGNQPQVLGCGGGGGGGVEGGPPQVAVQSLQRGLTPRGSETLRTAWQPGDCTGSAQGGVQEDVHKGEQSGGQRDATSPPHEQWRWEHQDRHAAGTEVCSTNRGEDRHTTGRSRARVQQKHSKALHTDSHKREAASEESKRETRMMSRQMSTCQNNTRLWNGTCLCTPAGTPQSFG